MLNGSAFQRQRAFVVCMRVRSHIVAQETAECVRVPRRSIYPDFVRAAQLFGAKTMRKSRSYAVVFFPAFWCFASLMCRVPSSEPSTTACRPMRGKTTVDGWNNETHSAKHLVGRAANLPANVLMCDMRCFEAVVGGRGENGKRRVRAY